MNRHLKPGIYRHGNDKDYLIFGEFTHTETGEVFLAHCEMTTPYKVRVSPKQDFVKGPRFSFQPETLLPEDALSPGIYRHFKKRDYMVVGEFIHDQTGEVFVCYRALYEPYASCARPKKMFVEYVDRPEHDYKGPRFMLIHPF